MTGPTFDVIVIGAGVAGLTAASAAARGGLSVACLEALMFGGLILNVNELRPGVAERPKSGCDLASELMTEGMDLGVASLSDTVTGLSIYAGEFTVACAEGQHRARAVIVASGARLRRLGVPGEVELEHRGVTQCADCDGPMYRGKDVAVIGGGDSALQEALVLSTFCNRVHLIHRGAGPSGSGNFVEALNRCGNVLPRWNTVVEEIIGEQFVTGVVTRSVSASATETIPCSGVFPFVGLTPNSEFLPEQIARDATGRLMTDAVLQTSMPGVFVAGAVRAGCQGLLTHAIADGRRAAESAAAYVHTRLSTG